MFFFIPNFRISEFMKNKNKSVILRGTPCEKKFDNSIIRDKKYISVILRGTPCEKKNSIIRDIKKKTVIIRDHPCERKTNRDSVAHWFNTCEKIMTESLPCNYSVFTVWFSTFCPSGHNPWPFFLISTASSCRGRQGEPCPSWPFSGISVATTYPHLCVNTY